VLRQVVLGCISLIASFAAVAQAGDADEFDAVVERYVAEGLPQQPRPAERKSRSRGAAQALAAARARFLPEISLQARYSRAEGGREFTIPVGAALNPLYSTLNELLAAQGRPPQFPRISDITVEFLREEEQDTRGRAPTALRTGDSRRSPRPARAARCEQLQPNGHRPRSAARYYDRLSRLAQSAQLRGHRRSQPGAAA
jgi:hypothetical protein